MGMSVRVTVPVDPERAAEFDRAFGRLAEIVDLGEVDERQPAGARRHTVHQHQFVFAGAQPDAEGGGRMVCGAGPSVAACF